MSALTPIIAAILRVAIYCRVSTPGQAGYDEEGNDQKSLGSQLADCRAYCLEHGYQIVTELQEIGSGMQLDERPHLTTLRHMVAEGAIDAVIAWDLDRLSRNPTHQSVLFYEFEERGTTTLEFVTEQFDRTLEGSMWRSMRGHMKAFEHRDIARRTQRGKRRRLELGAILRGRKVPYGYCYSDDGNRLLVDETTGPIVRWMFEQIDTGRTLHGIAKQLDTDGIPTPTGTGKGWRASSIHKFLRDRRYIGEGAGFRTQSIKIKGSQKWTKRDRPREEWIDLPPGTVAAIVDEPLFDRVQQRLAENRRSASRNNPDPEHYLLRGGFCRCGNCGHTMKAVRLPSGVTYYRCMNQAVPSAPCAAHASILSETLDALVLERINQLANNPKLVLARLAEQRQHDPSALDRKVLAKRAADIRKQIAQAPENLLGLKLSPRVRELIAQELENLEVKERELSEQLAILDQQRAAWEEAEAQTADIERACRAIGRLLGEQPDYGTLRDVLTYLGVQVRVWKDERPPEIKVELPAADAALISTTLASDGNKTFVLHWTTDNQIATIVR